MIQELLHLIFEGIVILLVTVKEFNYRKMWGKPECFIAIFFFVVKKEREREKTRKYYKIRLREKLGRKENILFKRILFFFFFFYIIITYDDR